MMQMEEQEQFQKAINMPVGEFIARLADFDVEAYTSFERIYPSLTAGSEFNPFAGFDVVHAFDAFSVGERTFRKRFYR